MTSTFVTTKYTNSNVFTTTKHQTANLEFILINFAQYVHDNFQYTFDLLNTAQII